MSYHFSFSVYLLNLLVKFKRLFCCMTRLYIVGMLSNYEKALCVKLSPKKVGVGIEKVVSQMYQIELAYVHVLVFRLFVGLMSVNPIFLLISVCVSKVLVLCTFYYEYSGIWCISHPLDSR